MGKHCWIILIVLNINISCTRGMEIVTFDETVTMYSQSQSGLVLRSEPSKESKNISLLSLNAEVKCNSRTTTEFKINGNSGYWYNCIYGNKIGWLFGAFLSYQKRFDPNKTNYYKIGGNDVSDIEFILYKNKEFVIKITIFPPDTENPSQKKDEYFEYHGWWEMQNNDLKLLFTTPTTIPRQLFESNLDKNIVVKINDRSFIIRGDLTELYIQGGLCSIVKIE